MDKLDAYERVNQTETLEELANVIESLADGTGFIQGRTQEFDAGKMAYYCRMFRNVYPQYLTRNYGIRQQAMMLAYQEKRG